MTPDRSAAAAPPSDVEVRFRSRGSDLVGTLLLPAGDGPFPAALLLPGSGPVDRNSDARGLRSGITRQLAEALAAAGVASLRYDKRGVGASAGDWRRAGFHDGADDAALALGVLAARAEVDPGRLVLVGHSEGALLATILAAGGAAVAGVALLSPSATPGDELLLWQADQLGPTLPAPVRLLLRLLRTDLRRSVEKNHARVRRTTTDVARLGGVRVNARWHREFMAYDPRPDLARTTVPVLALTGSKDLQARPDDLAVIAGLVRGPVRTELVDGVTHVLRHQPGRPSTSRYRREVRAPVDRRVLDAVVGWVGDVTGPGLSAPGSGHLSPGGRRTGDGRDEEDNHEGRQVEDPGAAAGAR